MDFEYCKRQGWIEKFHGDVVTPQSEDKFFIRDGTLTVCRQSGGNCAACDSATINASAQSGGDCPGFNPAPASPGWVWWLAGVVCAMIILAMVIS